MDPKNKNHLASNIITKGWMNISALTKGIILPTCKYIIRKRKGGLAGNDGWIDTRKRDEQHLIDDLRKIRENGEEIESITVFVNWDHQADKYGKTVYAQLIQKKIEAKLLYNDLDSHTIKVELIQENKEED